jgi:sporulation protein YlmC with PRC-barrel domain
METSMKRVLLTGAAALLALSPAAFAQTMQTGNNNPNTTASTARMAPAGQTSAGASVGMFASVPAQEELTSNVVGLEVYNNANQDIGKIKDVAFDANGVKAYIVAVGGFLGVGDHYVAVQPSAVRISYDASNKKWRAAMNTNADQLKAAPEYKYSSNG